LSQSENGFDIRPHGVSLVVGLEHLTLKRLHEPHHTLGLLGRDGIVCPF
jgi:hypothetical protein